MNHYEPLDTSNMALLHSASRKDEEPTQTDNVYLRLPDKPTYTLRMRLLPGKPGKKPYALYQAHRLNGRFYICRRVPEPTQNRLQWVAPPEGGGLSGLPLLAGEMAQNSAWSTA
jgi:hypothetical protein